MRSRRGSSGSWLKGGLALAAALSPWWAQGAELAPGTPGPTHCNRVEGDAARLACYDRWAGRSAGGEPAPAVVPAPVPVAEQEAPAAGPSSLWSAYWELDRQDKRGTFNFKTYKPNFILPAYISNAVNHTPSTPTRGTASGLPNYHASEVKLHLSLRTKLAQSVLLPGADLWFGYTQQSMWQLWNHAASAPFRNTDYEPELIYVVPVPEKIGHLPWGWRLAMLQGGAAHQSNGQSDPLSRSWNRIYLAAGLERGDMTVLLRSHRRVRESAASDDNPDLTRYVGRGDLQLGWTTGLSTASLLWRTDYKRIDRGSVQLDFTYPVDREKPLGLRWYMQLFSGYGETLLDYNFRRTSFGVGVSMFQF